MSELCFDLEDDYLSLFLQLTEPDVADLIPKGM